MYFETCLSEQIQMHPSLQPRDVVKLCYQAVFGAEHLLADAEKAKKYLQEEYDAVAAMDIPLYEPISAEICRVNLAAWKFHGLPAEWLFSMLAASPFAKKEREGLFRQYLAAAEKVMQETSVTFSAADWQIYLTEYQKTGLTPVHHSEIYRKKENPAYRIVDRKYIRLFPILQRVAEKRNADRPCIIAIDGRAASGKKWRKYSAPAGSRWKKPTFRHTELRKKQKYS